MSLCAERACIVVRVSSAWTSGVRRRFLFFREHPLSSRASSTMRLNCGLDPASPAGGVVGGGGERSPAGFATRSCCANDAHGSPTRPPPGMSRPLLSRLQLHERALSGQ